MPRLILIAGHVILGCAAAPFPLLGQAFEVASVRPSPPPDPSARNIFGPPHGGPGTQDPGQITWSNAILMSVLTTAYDVKPYQVRGPDWLGTERFDIIAKVPAGATKEQVAVMWQNLLKDRFGVVLHREPKEFAGDELVVAKGGPRLKPTNLDSNVAPDDLSAGPPKTDPNGFPELHGPGMLARFTPGPNGIEAHLVAKAQTMEQLADILGMQHPVKDKTGLTGHYDFSVAFTPDPPDVPLQIPGGPAAAPPRAPDRPPTPDQILASGLPELGLRLVPSKVTVDMLVIDHADKTPAEN